jgi:hypothetical protein
MVPSPAAVSGVRFLDNRTRLHHAQSLAVLNHSRALSQGDARAAGQRATAAVRLLLSALFAAALAQPTNEPSDHERGQKERDDHAYADEHIGENDSGAVLDGHGARSRSASVPLYDQSGGLPRRFRH